MLMLLRDGQDLYICCMKTFGKLSIILFVAFNIVFTGIFVYFIYTGIVEKILIFLPLINIALMFYLVYRNYMLVHLDAHELIIERPFKKTKTTYFFSDIQAVSIEHRRDGRNKVLVMTIYKKDNTNDEYIATSMQLERNALIKELRKRADVL